MKSKHLLSIMLLCTPLLLMEANNLTLVQAEAATENVIVYNQDTKEFNNDFGWYTSSGEKSSPVLNGSYLQLTGGAYIESSNAYYIEGGTTVTFKIDRISTVVKSTTTSNGNRITFSVYDENKNIIDTETIKPSKTTNGEMVSELDIEQTGNYYFRITSDSTSSTASGKYYTRIYTTHITYTPHVEQTTPDIYSDKFAAEKTLSQMAVSYSKSVVDESVNYDVNEVVLRYGARVDYENMWSSLDVISYGVAVAKTNELNGATLTELLNNNDLSDAAVLASYENVKFAQGDVDNVTRVNAVEDLFVEDQNGEYVLFNARIVVPESDYNTLVNAVAYVVFEEDGVNKVSLFEEVVGDCVVKQANWYLDNGEYSEDVTNVLSLLAE